MGTQYLVTTINHELGCLLEDVKMKRFKGFARYIIPIGFTAVVGFMALKLNQTRREIWQLQMGQAMIIYAISGTQQRELNRKQRDHRIYKIATRTNELIKRRRLCEVK